MSPFGVDEPLPIAAIEANKYEQFLGELTNVTVETFQQTNSTYAAASNDSSNFDQSQILLKFFVLIIIYYYSICWN
jgi:hypothetical protein